MKKSKKNVYQGNDKDRMTQWMLSIW